MPCLPARGQEKRIENNIYVGLGWASELATEDAPLPFHIGCGLDYYHTRHLSVMPGVGYRAKFEVRDADADISVFDSSFIDIPVLA